MRFSFLPTVIADSVIQLTPQRLEAMGIKLLMLDFDNTIVPYTTDTPTDTMTAWLKAVTASDIAVCVVSNSHKDRVKIFCEKYGLTCTTHAKKPSPKGILACVARYGLSPENCALAGDQIYTDVLGANRAGVQSILVKAIDNHNFWLKARHVLEKPWISISIKRRIDNEKY